MGVNQTFTVKQKQKVNQNLIQMVGILQMNRQELLDFLREQESENPLLEVSDMVQQSAMSDREDDWMEQLEGKQETFSDVLLEQLLLEPISSIERQVINDIIYNLDERGFFVENISNIAKRNQVDEKFLDQCLKKIQQLEPAGVGAHNLEECLLIQMKRNGEKNLIAEQIIRDYLELVAKNHLSKIASSLNCKLEEVKEACNIIRQLNPKPSNGWTVNENLKYILPDFQIVAAEDEIQIEFMDSSNDIVKIQEPDVDISYLSDDVQKYLLSKRKQAEQVIQMVQNRKNTLYKIMVEIVRYQKEFFIHGVKYIKPLRMQTLAEKLGIHESTVSRGIKGKYFQCQWGVFPISFLFAKVSSQNKNVTISIKDRIKEVIEAEDKTKPLSDAKIQLKLAEEGCAISRRTVAKYRMQIGILDASGRKSVEENAQKSYNRNRY